MQEVFPKESPLFLVTCALEWNNNYDAILTNFPILNKRTVNPFLWSSLFLANYICSRRSIWRTKDFKLWGRDCTPVDVPFPRYLSGSLIFSVDWQDNKELSTKQARNRIQLAPPCCWCVLDSQFLGTGERNCGLWRTAPMNRPLQESRRVCHLAIPINRRQAVKIGKRICRQFVDIWP